MFNKSFCFFIENSLVSSYQSGFKPGDSRINQLLFKIHKIYKCFDNGFDVRGVFFFFFFFFDISRVFDKVWHKGFILKLKQNSEKYS